MNSQTCKHCKQPIGPGGYWTGTAWSGYEHIPHYNITCYIDGKLGTTKAEPSTPRYTIGGYNRNTGEWTEPVEIRCPTCGDQFTSETLPYGLPHLDELVDWTRHHTCPTWSVT